MGFESYRNFGGRVKFLVIVFGRLSAPSPPSPPLRFISKLLMGNITCLLLQLLIICVLNYVAASGYRILRHSRRPFVLWRDKTFIRLKLCCCFKPKKMRKYYHFLVACVTMLHSYNARFISLLFGEPTSHLSTVDTFLNFLAGCLRPPPLGQVAPAAHRLEGEGVIKRPIFYYFVVLMARQRDHVCCSNAGIQRG